MRDAGQPDHLREAAKVVGIAAAAILVAFVVYFLQAEISFTERPQVEIPRNPGDRGQAAGRRELPRVPVAPARRRGEGAPGNPLGGLE